MSGEDLHKQLAKLEKQLQSKQLEVNSLLEVTQAINNNLPARSLFRIYEFILRAQVDLNKLVLFVKNDEVAWECMICYGVDKAYKELDVEAVLTGFTEQSDLDKAEHEPLRIFDLVVPVFHKERPLAYALVGGIERETEALITKEEKIKFIQTITNIILVAIENKRLFKRQLEQEGLKRELELAAHVQNMLIPDSLPQGGQVSMSAIYSPHKEVGGDYYDCIRLNEDEWVFCVADISGKGMAAALLMANFQANIRALIKQNLSLEIFMHLLNENVNHITKGEKFITFFMGKLNFKLNNLTYINAGHNPPLFYDGQTIRKLEKGCTILGIFEELPVIQVEELKINGEGMIVCYTDGLTELENEHGEFYEINRLEDFLRNNAGSTPAAFNEILFEDLNNFRGKKLFGDDITILTTRLGK